MHLPVPTKETQSSHIVIHHPRYPTDFQSLFTLRSSNPGCISLHKVLRLNVIIVRGARNVFYAVRLVDRVSLLSKWERGEVGKVTYRVLPLTC